MSKTITESEALQIIADDEAENMPYRVINAAGRAAVATWVKTTASESDRHNLDAWYTDAERAANDAIVGESIRIEMRGMHTASGNPVTLDLPAAAFDWVVRG